MAVSEFANSAAEGAGPDRAIMALKGSVYAVLSEAVCLSVGLGYDRAAGVAQMCQPASLAGNPQFFPSPGDGIDDIFVEAIAGNTAVFFPAQPVKAAFAR